MSYRRADGVAAGARTAIYKALQRHYGPHSVFMDVETLQLAQDFRQSLHAALNDTDLMVLLIGPQWVELMRDRGGDRDDFVRIEVETALKFGKPIMPLLLGSDAIMPGAQDLPESIQSISFNHGVQLDTGRYFDAGIARLITDLDAHIFADFAALRRRKYWSCRIAAGVAIALVGAGVLHWSPWQQGDAEKSTAAANQAPAASSAEKLTANNPIENISDNTARIADSLENISEKFSALTRAGGVINDARVAHELYHNARVYETRGDYVNARKSYLALFATGSEELDPYLRFAGLLRVQEGRAGAEQTFRSLPPGADQMAVAYVQAWLAQAPRRRLELQRIVAERGNYAPAYFHLSETFGLRDLGDQSLGEMREERRLLEQFQAADEAGNLLRHLIDHSLAQTWRKDARERLTASRSRVGDATLAAPVALSWMSSSAGWTANIQVAEPALAIEWRESASAQFAATGNTPHMDSRTGQAMPQPFFQVPLRQAKTTFVLRYQDRRKTWQGPYEFSFEPAKEALASNTRLLNMTRTSWLAFRNFDGKLLLYFTTLMSYRGAIEQIRYGLDSENTNIGFDFPVWEGPGIAPINADTPVYLEIPAATKFVTVQLQYKDGTDSKTVRFER